MLKYLEFYFLCIYMQLFLWMMTEQEGTRQNNSHCYSFFYFIEV